MKRSIFIGWDPREASAFAVARHSILRRLITPIPVRGLVLSDLRARGLYKRPMSIKDGRLWDDISDAPCATEFACSRFLIKELAQKGWAMFLDCDMLARTNVEKLFKICEANPSKAVMVVKHQYDPPEGIKMDGQLQLRYSRKNWSSVMMVNCDHPANAALTPALVNSVPGRNLHAFCWLEDDQIGELDQSWNFLIGHTAPEIEADIAHFTEGLPYLPEYADCAYADEWRAELERWAA